MKYFIMLIMMSITVFAGEGEVPKIVKDQIDQISPNLIKAKSEYAKKIKSENDKLCKAIEVAMTKETRSGNLDNAMALKSALEMAKNGDYISDILNPPVSDLLSDGDVGGGSLKSKLIGAEVANWKNPRITVIPPYKIENKILRFYDGGGFEFTVPKGAKVSIIIKSGSLPSWNPLDVGRVYANDVEVYNQSWGSRQAFDAKRIESMTFMFDNAKRILHITINDKIYQSDIPIADSNGNGVIRIIDRGGSAYGSNISEIEFK